MDMVSRILVIDDDIRLCDLLGKYLSREGFVFEMVHRGEDGVARALSGEHSLVVLDVMLPGLNGFDVLSGIRRRSQIPVLMLTARGDDVDRIVGLELGADDYLPKPFNPREFTARIRAILRRAKPDTTWRNGSIRPERLAVGDIELDPVTRVVTRAGELVALTLIEYGLLELLMRCAGEVVTREELVTSVLGRRIASDDRSLDTHISNLRRKLGHFVGGVERIKTVRGVGFILGKPEDAQKERSICGVSFSDSLSGSG
jgi:two-component system response regulator CpxR